MRSITTTLTLFLGLAATAIFLVALAIVVWQAQRQDRDKAPCELASRILNNAVVVEPGRALTVRPTTDLERLKSTSPNLWYVVSYDGLAAEFGTFYRPALPFSLPYTGPAGLSILAAADQSRTLCLDIKPRGHSFLSVVVGGAQSGFRQSAMSFVMRNISSILMLALAFAATVGISALLAANIVARSIGRVTALALAIEPSSPHAAILLEVAPAELRPLVSALNRAFGEIDAYVQRQRRFLGNAAHQLRTPLTLLRAKVDDVPDPALKAELVRDVRRLSSLVAAMLDLARLQSRAIEKRPIDLGVLTRDVLADFGPSALDAGVELSLDQPGPDAIVVQGVEAAIRSALANLVSNALIHAEGARRIVAEVGAGRVSIHDDGTASASDPPSIFTEPFQTGGKSGGAGIGLPIVQEIMAAHGGTFTLSSVPGRGTTATLCFPETEKQLAPLPAD